jgi:hypothetical protein
MSFVNEERIGKLTIDERIKIIGVLELTPEGSFPVMDARLDLKADKTELGDAEEAINQAIDLKADISLLNQEVDTLNNEINLKADQTFVDNAISLKADQTALDGVETSLTNAINLKADQTSLDDVETSLTNAINLKADQTSLDSEVSTLNGAINLKADQTALDDAVSTLNTAVDLKADQTALDGAVSTLNTAVDLKADQTALDDAVSTLNGAIDLKADQTSLDNALTTINNAIGLKADQTSLDDAVADLNTAIDLKADQTSLDLKADEATLSNYATTSYVNGNFMSAPDKYDALTGLIPDGKWTNGEDYVSHRLSPYATVDYVNASTLTSGAISTLISTATTGLATTSALEVATEAIGTLETQIGAIETTAVYKPVDWLTETEGFTLKEYVENKVGGETSDVVRKPTDFDSFGGDLQAYVENKTIPQPSDWANGVDELDEYVREKTQNIPDSSRIFGTTPTLQFQKSSGAFGEGSETDYSITSDPFVPFGIYRKNTDPLGVQSWEGYAFTIQNNGDVNIPKTLGLKVNNLNVAIADDHYTKSEMNTKLAERAVGADVYTKVETDDLLLLKADSVSTYGKEQSDERFALKTDVQTNSTAINSTILPAITALENTRASTTAPAFTGTSTFENAVVSGTLNNGSGVSYALTSDHYTKGEVDNQIGGLGIVYYNKTEVDDKLADYTLTSELPTGLSDVVTEDPTFVMTSSFGIKMVHRHLGGYYPDNFITEQTNIPVPTSGVASLQYLVEELISRLKMTFNDEGDKILNFVINKDVFDGYTYTLDFTYGYDGDLDTKDIFFERIEIVDEELRTRLGLPQINNTFTRLSSGNDYGSWRLVLTFTDPVIDNTTDLTYLNEARYVKNGSDGILTASTALNSPLMYNPTGVTRVGNDYNYSTQIGGGGSVQFRIDNTERMRINNSGRVGIRTTSPTDTLDVNGNMRVTGGSSSSFLYFRNYGSISRIYNGSSGAGIHFTGGAVYPADYLGNPTQGIAFGGSHPYRWGQIYSTSTTISNSDRNLKRDIIDLTQTERKVANRIRKLVKNFKFNDAYDKKGDDARIHTGVIAQEIEEAFTAEGLDASRYGLFCKDDLYVVNGDDKIYDDEGEWTGQFVNADTPGAVVQSTEYSVRYEELLAFVVSNLASLEDIERLEARVEALENNIT